jgi:hypothetical protein
MKAENKFSSFSCRNSEYQPKFWASTEGLALEHENHSGTYYEQYVGLFHLGVSENSLTDPDVYVVRFGKVWVKLRKKEKSE